MKKYENPQIEMLIFDVIATEVDTVNASGEVSVKAGQDGSGKKGKEGDGSYW